LENLSLLQHAEFAQFEMSLKCYLSESFRDEEEHSLSIRTRVEKSSVPKEIYQNKISTTVDYLLRRATVDSCSFYLNKAKILAKTFDIKL